MTHVSMFKLEPVNALFLDDAQYRYVFSMDLAATAEEVWAGLTADEPQSWCRMLTDVRFTSQEPHGIGASRTSEVARGVLKFHERFFAWEEDERHQSFYVESVNLPLLRAFAEDYRITPTDSGCHLRWIFAFDAKPGFGALVKFGLPLIGWLLRSLARDTQDAFGGRHELPGDMSVLSSQTP